MLVPVYAFVIPEWAGISEGEGWYCHMSPYTSPVQVWDQLENAHVFVDRDHKPTLGVASAAIHNPDSTPPFCQLLHCTK